MWSILTGIRNKIEVSEYELTDRPQYINSQVFLLTVIDSHVIVFSRPQFNENFFFNFPFSFP